MRQTAILLLVLGLASAADAQKKSKYGDLPLDRFDRLRADLRSEKAETRKHALNTIQHSLLFKLAPEVVALVDDPEVRKEAIYAVGRLGWEARAAVPRLLKALKDDDWEVRRRAAEALGGVSESGKGVLPALLAALGDPHQYVRCAAAEAIGYFRDEGRPAFAELVKLMKHGGREVRTAAARSIGWLAADRSVAWLAADSRPALEVILPLLRSEDVADWNVAGYAMYWMGENAAPAVPLLIKAMASTDRSIRNEAIHMLGKIGPAIRDALPVIIEALHDEFPAVRTGAIRALYAIGPDAAKALPELLEVYAKLDIQDQQRVVRTLGNFGPAAVKAVPSLVTWMGDGGFQSELFVDALAEIGPAAKEATPALLRYLDKAKEHPDRRIAAAKALWKIAKHAVAVPTLMDVIRKDRYSYTSTAALALAEIGADGLEALPLLIAKLGEPNKVDHGVLNALGKFGPEARDAVPALVNILDKTDTPYTKVYVATVLWKEHGHARALAVLLEQLRKNLGDASFNTRLHAALQLGALGKDAAPAAGDLVAVLRDERAWVRVGAADALAAIGDAGPEVVTSLSAALKDEIWTVRVAAARTLGKLGPAARDALPALANLRDDPLVAEAAVEAARRIGSD